MFCCVFLSSPHIKPVCCISLLLRYPTPQTPILSIPIGLPLLPLPFHPPPPSSSENHTLLCPAKSELASPVILLILHQEGQVQYLHSEISIFLITATCLLLPVWGMRAPLWDLPGKVPTSSCSCCLVGQHRTREKPLQCRAERLQKKLTSSIYKPI